MRKIGIDPEKGETLVALTDDEYRALCELGVAWGERIIPAWTLNLGRPPSDEILAPALRAVKTWVATKFEVERIVKLGDDLRKLLGDGEQSKQKIGTLPWEKTDAYEILSLTATSVPDRLRDVLELHYVAGRFDGTLVHLAQISKAELLLDSVDVLACHAISARIGRWRFLKSL